MHFSSKAHTHSAQKPALNVRYASDNSNDAGKLKLDPAHTLAMIQFGSAGQTRLPHTDVHVFLPALSAQTHYEIWETRDPLSEGNLNGVTYRKNDDILFCKLSLPETASDNISDLTHKAYDQLLQCTQQLGYPHLLRIWNYFDDINKHQDNMERYQSFCVGRHQSYQEYLGDSEQALPAASGIGSTEGDLVIYLIASNQAGIQIENPRQVSAFKYPKQYGPTSPSFARATLKHWQNMSQLFISGTASIVGHETVHEENVLIQLDETLKNLDSLIDTVKQNHQLPVDNVNDISLLKVYIRHAKHYPLIEKALKQKLDNDIPVIFLQGDICRPDLLMEIEGVVNIYHD